MATVHRWANPSPNLYIVDDLSKVAELSKTSGFTQQGRQTFFSRMKEFICIDGLNILGIVHMYSCCDCLWIALFICRQLKRDFIVLFWLYLAVTHFLHTILFVEKDVASTVFGLNFRTLYP